MNLNIGDIVYINYCKLTVHSGKAKILKIKPPYVDVYFLKDNVYQSVDIKDIIALPDYKMISEVLLDEPQKI